MMIMNIVRRQVAPGAPEDTISLAARRMDELSTDVIFVTVEGRPIGMVTSRDIAIAVAVRGSDPQAPVREIMTRNTLAVEEEDYIFTAEQYMSERRVRYLPVVDSSGRLTGLVTYEDLLLHMTSERLERVRESHCRLSSD
jgi:signal-transduction protein with cAMP-binding, CBS, and nucleotidyltransferase domain